jgi:hypothetical protein
VKFEFRHHIIDQDLPKGLYAQTAAADLDNDGRLEYIVGQQYGTVYCYKHITPEKWTRHVLGHNSPSDVGACVLDVDGDGWIDLVVGGAWFKNSRNLGQSFTRVVFDPELRGVHDVFAADLDRDGRQEIVTMSDQSTLRWYKIPDDPSELWKWTEIGKAVHAGVVLGDVDGDGDVDVVRSTSWFENVKGDGTEWIEHTLGPTTPPPDDFRPPFAFDATRGAVVDMNGDGKNDIVLCDAEIPGGRIWWLENLDGRGRSWKRHDVPNGDPVRRGAYHGLYVGDLDGDGDYDLFSCEMEAVPGERNPRYYIWENLDGKGNRWAEHVILDMNLGGHEAVLADFTGRGRLDIISKPWQAREKNALGGRMFVMLLENVSQPD